MNRSRTPLTPSEQASIEMLEQYAAAIEDDGFTRDEAVAALIERDVQRADAVDHIEQLLLKGYLYEVKGTLRLPADP